MSKNLMIIESPNKIKTISKYLKNDSFEIMATYGHLRNLSKKGMGFNRETLEPIWEISDDSKPTKGFYKKKTNSLNKEDILKNIIKAADASEQIYLASDPDREGEAISWHIYELLSSENQRKCKRVVFNEITQTAVENGLENARDIVLNWVYSYFARRLLDREIGFKLSSVVRSRIGGISAGRVQSVALKFLRDRENEIKKFIPENWYTLDVTLQNKLQLNLKKINPKLKDLKINENIKNGKVNFVDEISAEKILKELKPDYNLIKKYPVVIETSNPALAYKTSTLQQDGISKLNLTSKNVESVAQKLYEGVEIGNEVVGLITYPRTDRTDLSESFVEDAKNFIEKNYGLEYFAKKDEIKKPVNTDPSKTPIVQGAHEAIRPSNLFLTPKHVEKYLNKQEYQLYCLIWIRALGSLMSKAEFFYNAYDFDNNNNIFHGHTRDMKFEGYKKIYAEWSNKISKTTTGIEHDENEADQFILQKITNLKENDLYPVKTTEIKKHEKKPPTRFNEATLIKHLENEGIGRPSTYVSIANLVVNRYYAIKKNKALEPTQLGLDVTDQLDKNFSDIMTFSYTRNMEEDLDKIANGDLEWKSFLHKVFDHFESQLTLAKNTMPKKAPPEVVGKDCPLCSMPLVYRQSFRTNQISKFVGCSGYPKCNFIENLEKPKLLEDKCPECDHQLIVRKNRRGQEFVGCSHFPACRYIKKEEKVKTEKESTKTKKVS